LGLNQSATTRVVVRKRKKSVVVVESGGPNHNRNHLSVSMHLESLRPLLAS
jgi:hypothetical protein